MRNDVPILSKQQESLPKVSHAAREMVTVFSVALFFSNSSRSKGQNSPPPPREVLRPISESSTQLLKKTRFSAGFLRLGKFFSAYLLKIQFICVQNVMM